MIMPRNVKDSDDEMEVKSGRRTRAALNPTVLDSPLRRSTRIKQPVYQDSSSPESTSDVSGVGTTRTTRRRTMAGDTSIIDPARNLRTRCNSVASDISELTETDSLHDGPAKRVTRRSIAGISTVETSSKLNGRTRRTTRAGSETKSTPPLAKATRRTRATSLEPEGTEDEKNREMTPIKSRRRASALPTEPVVAEEPEDSGRRNHPSVDKTVYEIEEVDFDSPSNNTSKSSRRKSKIDDEFVEKMEVDEDPVKESEDNTIKKSTQENTKADGNISHIPKNLEDFIKVGDSSEAKKVDDGSSQLISSISKSSSYTIETIVSPSTEKQEKSPGNKENEILNDSAVLLEKSEKLSNIDVRILSRKSVNSSYVKPLEKCHNISVEDSILVDFNETPTKPQEDVNTELAKKLTKNLNRKERHSVDDCVVLIEPMEIDRVDKIVSAKTSNISETPKIQKAYEAVEVKSEATGNEEIDCELTGKEVENPGNLINEIIADSETDLKISNVVSMMAGEVDEEKEEQESIDDSEPIEALRLESNDTSDINEAETLSEGINDEKVYSESLRLNVEPRASNSAENKLDDDANDENMWTEPSILNPDPQTTNSDENTPSYNVNNEIASTEPSGLNVEPIASGSVINNEIPINSDEIEDNLVLAKGRKSSIVTESPTIAANGEESSNASEEKKKRKSASNGRSSVAVEQKNTSDEIEDKSLEKEIECEKIVLQSDEESEYDGYPAFKDIPADEWTRGDTEESKKDADFETNSVHSVSTQRNESECDFELIDNDILQSVVKGDQVRSDYDSDDTLKIAIATRKSKEQKDKEKEEEPATVNEMPVELFSGDTNTPLTNKNMSMIVDTSDKCSLVNLNVSRRKSLLRVDDQSNNTPNSSMKLNNSLNKSSTKCSLNVNARPGENTDSDNKREADNAEVSTSKTVNRKSLEASGKKLKDRTLDSSNITVSATNTPSNAERNDNQTSTKRNRSLNKSARLSQYDGAGVSSDNATESESAQNGKWTDNLAKYALETAIKKELRARLSTSNASYASFSKNDSPTSPNIDEDRFNRSAKIENIRKSLNDKNSSMIVESDSDIEVGASASAKKSMIKKNNWKNAQSLNSEAERFQDSPASPEPEEEICESIKKMTRENYSKLQLVNSDSKIPLEDYQKNPVSSKAEEEESDTSVEFGKMLISKFLFDESGSDSDDENSQEKKDKYESFQKIVKEHFSKIELLNSSSKVGDQNSQEKLTDHGNIKEKAQEYISKMELASPNSAIDVEDTEKNSPKAEEETLEKSVKSVSAKKKPRENLSKMRLSKLLLDSSDSEVDDENSQEKVKASTISVTSSESVTGDEYSENSDKSSKSGSTKKSRVDKNYSTIVQINSDSEVDEAVESNSSDEANVEETIPQFLFAHSSNSDDDSSGSIDSDVARELNLHGKSVLEYSDDDVPADDCMATESESSDDGDDGADLIDFIDDDYEEDVIDLCVEEDKTFELSKTKTPRKRIIRRPARASDLDESEEKQPANVSYASNNSKNDKTPTKTTKLNETQKILEPEDKFVDPRISVKGGAAKKDKNLLIQSSTPKTLARQSLLLENLNSSKATTPADKLLKPTNSSVKLKVSSSKRLSKSACETIDTPMKPGSSFKLAKTPKIPTSAQQQLQTSLPADLTDPSGETNLSKTKSTKIMTLNQSVIPPSSESPETRFLMKEKLNVSMPMLKLQQRARALRRSGLGSLREEVDATDKVLAEIGEIQGKNAEKRVSLDKEKAASDLEVSTEKKKKKKKKKHENSNVSENLEEEVATPFIDSVTEVDEVRDSLGTSTKKSKKLNKKKKAADTPKPKDLEVEEIPIKKKTMKKQEKSIERAESDEANKKEKKKKKKKDRKSAELIEPEVPALRQKSRRIAAQNFKASDSNDAPEAIGFTEARDAALTELRKLTESTKASLEAKKKKKHQESFPQERKSKTRAEVAISFEKIKTSVKRLPDDVLENLSDVAERPKKKRKVVKEEKIVPLTTMYSSHPSKLGNFNVHDGDIPLSSSGGTTQFSVVNLKKSAKYSKKALAASTFRERMLARNPRQPVSAYLIYQQKQKASGKGKPY